MTTKNLPISTPGVLVLPFNFPGANAATAVARARFDLPFPAKLLDVQVSARSSTGTDPTLDIDVQAGGESVLDAEIAVTAATVTHGVIATDRLADEAELTIDFTIGGTSSPTFNDVQVVLTLVRI
ncbi:hypothetical protein [Thalassobaculum litoreum]|uniref:Uncharacterized protein n=1 Tax=Thalassobaculum litoreum DSM 18839 TaxID=1123362 RepID=A0A8G2BMU4_9PROT|nr:hypothetical protein [Thalassobaculum litoreum]SDG60708.1 hypothetical protein SAMN05660686_04999 [Thalassobaculum litoreum DSM 18839]